MFSPLVRWLKRFVKWFGFLLLILCITTLIKLFVLDTYQVISGSMERSIYIGDQILINKLHYGPVWPQTPLEIPWFNLLALNTYLQPWYKDTKWGYKRWPKGEEVKKNDVVVLRAPFDRNNILVKRVVGLPGDTLEMTANTLLINRKPEGDLLTFQYWYEIISGLENIPDTIKLKNQIRISEYYTKSLLLTNEEACTLTDNYHIKIRRIDYQEDQRRSTFCQLVVPKAGMKIQLDSSALAQYPQIFSNIMETDPSHWRGSTFTFQTDYYFMMGDNRHQSVDSRIWGLVPEEYILGKADFVLFSTSEKFTLSDRLLNQIM